MRENEDYQQPSVREVLTREQYEHVTEQQSEKPGVFLLAAEKAGERLFIKGSETVKNGVDRIENQMLADALLHTEVTGQSVHVPDGHIKKTQGYTLGVMQRVEGQLLAEAKPGDLKEALSEQDIQALVDWLAAVRHIPSERIPEHFHDVAKNVWNKNFYTERLEQNAKSPIDLGMLTESELQTLKQIWEQHYGLLTFQHHDVVPFNIMRGTDNKLWLIDGEFARLGMAGYDPAYFALQTYALYGEGEMAAQMLEKALDAWRQQFPEDHLDTAILAPLAYRIVASLNDEPTKTHSEVRERTLRLKELILKADIQELIRGLRA